MHEYSRVFYGPEHLSVRDLTEAISLAFQACGIEQTQDHVARVIRTAVESTNRMLKKQPDGYLIVHFLDFFQVIYEVFEELASQGGVDIESEDDWTLTGPEVCAVMTALRVEGAEYLFKSFDQGFIQRHG